MMGADVKADIYGGLLGECVREFQGGVEGVKGVTLRVVK